MGTRGPIPKRDEERIRRNTPDVPTETITVIGSFEIPELGIDDPHPFVTDFYESLKDSGQARYYEPSDWQYARLALLLLDEALKIPGRQGISPMKVQNVIGMLSDLLVTEGDRRRVRMEVERDTGAEAQVVDLAEEMKKRFSF